MWWLAGADSRRISITLLYYITSVSYIISILLLLVYYYIISILLYIILVYYMTLVSPPPRAVVGWRGPTVFTVAAASVLLWPSRRQRRCAVAAVDFLPASVMILKNYCLTLWPFFTLTWSLL